MRATVNELETYVKAISSGNHQMALFLHRSLDHQITTRGTRGKRVRSKLVDKARLHIKLSISVTFLSIITRILRGREQKVEVFIRVSCHDSDDCKVHFVFADAKALTSHNPLLPLAGPEMEMHFSNREDISYLGPDIPSASTR